MATRTRSTIRPEALRAAAAFPALEAIFTRRARRFALGAELTGPLAYRSEHDPVPLGYEEEAILVAAATGITGVASRSGRSSTPRARRRAATSSRRSPDARTRAPSPTTTSSCSGRTTTASSACRSATSSRSGTARTAARSTTSTRCTGRQSSSRTGGSTSRAGARTCSRSTSDPQPDRHDAVHARLRRDAAVHLRAPPLLRPPARLLRPRPAAGRRPAAAVRALGPPRIEPTRSTCATSSAGRWSTRTASSRASWSAT